MAEAKDVIRAAKQGDAALLGRLLDEDPTAISAVDKDGSTPLHCAVWKGHVEIVRMLLERGADIARENANTHWGGTPLHAAAHGDQRAAAKLLIDHGADVNACSFNGRTPLEETTIHDAKSVARLLRENGATG